MTSMALNPAPEQDMVAADLLRKLNLELHQGGTWVVLLTHPPKIPILVTPEASVVYAFIRLMWLDEDGDVQFTVEIEEELEDVMLAGIIHWMEQAYDAWNKWKHHMRDVLDPSEKHGEVVREAAGEKRTAVDVDIGLA